MKIYQVEVIWANGLQHSYCIDEKRRPVEQQKLDQYNYLKSYNIKEIDSLQAQKLTK